LLHVEHRIAVVRGGGDRQRRGEQRGEQALANGVHRSCPHSCGTFTGVPFFGSPESSTLPFASLTSRNSPPGWPSRSGFIRRVTLSPRLSELRLQPCRLRLFGLLSSMLQWVTLPSAGTSISMNACGLVHWNSVPVPSSVMTLRWSNMAKL